MVQANEEFIDNPIGKNFIREVVPAGRLGEPKEIGELIHYLANMKGSFHTGTIIKFAVGLDFGLAAVGDRLHQNLLRPAETANKSVKETAMMKMDVVLMIVSSFRFVNSTLCPNLRAI